MAPKKIKLPPAAGYSRIDYRDVVDIFLNQNLRLRISSGGYEGSELELLNRLELELSRLVERYSCPVRTKDRP